MILARIQGHPDRGDLHAPLSKALAPLPVELRIHSSDPPDPWAGYRACLSGIPGSYSHLLILQDDAQPCENFVPALELIAEHNPTVPICLFMGNMPASTAAVARRQWGKRSYVPLLAAGFVPLVAVLWPVEVAKRFLLWSTGHRRVTRADDGNAARFMRETKQPFLVSVPSLVEHNDFVPSVKGGRDHKPGLEKWRRAMFLAENALDHKW